MKERLTPSEWAEEFQEFVSSPGARPPQDLTEGILRRVAADLNPSLLLVAAKLSLIHLVVGSITLLFCPQFGVNLGGESGLMGLLMQYGEHACMLGCGAVFMAGSALACSLILRPEEIRKLRRTELLIFPALALFSLGALTCLGASIAASLALSWFAGSVLSGLGTLELGWLVRRMISNFGR